MTQILLLSQLLNFRIVREQTLKVIIKWEKGEVEMIVVFLKQWALHFSYQRNAVSLNPNFREFPKV